MLNSIAKRYLIINRISFSDFKNNIIFEKEDITTKVLLDNSFLDKWYTDNYSKYITEEKYQVSNVGSYWNRGSKSFDFSDFDDSYYGRYK